MMVLSRIPAAIAAAVFFVASPVFAQSVPQALSDPAGALNLAQQQLTNLHKAYDELERQAALLNQQDQNLQKQLGDQKQEIQRWQQYYAACKPGADWLCDEAPRPPEPNVQVAEPPAPAPKPQVAEPPKK